MLLSIMRIHYLFLLAIILFSFPACSDSGTGSETGSTNKALGIRLINTGSEDLEVESRGDVYTVFCYKSEGCETFEGGGLSAHTIFPDNPEAIINYSSTDDSKTANGVKVAFKVISGEGKAEIVQGRAYVEDGWPEFEASKVVHTSNAFSTGETVRFEYGNTD
ncbi:hypothetical protein [Fodinibius salsisoli]|uniref:Uncharacterized protein n=1 Tax=Fodinibius salsisoli TaxID=2820877 RepID=A0ABT3PLV2_9BACT|nr:hypothetical protein [Fodinibius salsisoli]MCW9706901.1 hypothetical protein [Fodinibius salsisoli]